MDLQRQIVELGKGLGYEGKDLREYVEKEVEKQMAIAEKEKLRQENLEREERAKRREEEREKGRGRAGREEEVKQYTHGQ